MDTSTTESVGTSDLLRRRLSRYVGHPLVVMLVLLFLALGLGLLQFHTSSVGIYHTYLYGPSVPDPNLLLGQPRPIRSDEYELATINYLVQFRPGFLDADPNSGPPMAGMATPWQTPLHWRTLFRPFVWPAFLFPLEIAFAISWWLRVALLLGSSYVLLHRLANRDVGLATVGAMAITFSPYMQWWLVNNMIDFAAYLFVGLWLLIGIVEARRTRHVVLLTAALCYAGACFVTMNYPPFLVGVGLLGLALATGILLDRGSERLSWPAVRRLGPLLLVPITAAVVLLVWRIEFAEAIEAIQATVHPGQRRIAGGGFALAWLFSGFFNVELLSESATTGFGLQNQSEAAAFLFLAPVLMPLTLWNATRAIAGRTWSMADPFGLALVGYLGLALAWMFTGLPGPLGRLLLLDVVPAQRLLLPVGLASMLYVIHTLSRPGLVLGSMPRHYVPAAAAGMFALHVWVGYKLAHDPPFDTFTDAWIVAVSVVAALLTVALLTTRRRLFVAVLLAVTLSAGLPVNPLYRGLDPVLHSPLSDAIRRVVAADGSQQGWLAYNHHFLAPLLLANGAKTYGHYQNYPSPEFWRVIDPEGTYTETANRFAQITFVADAKVGGSRVVLDTVSTIFIHMHPCDPALDRLEVRYVVTQGILNAPCLRTMFVVPSRAPAFTIYRRERG